MFEFIYTTQVSTLNQHHNSQVAIPLTFYVKSRRFDSLPKKRYFYIICFKMTFSNNVDAKLISILVSTSFFFIFFYIKKT